MYRINKEEIIEKLKSRLSSQRRIFNYDENQILVLPVFEHKGNILESIEKIKFYINSNGDFLKINEITELKQLEDGGIGIINNNADMFFLHNRKMNGEISKIRKNNFSFKNLTIDHSPSIQIVLYTMYLNKTIEFSALALFCNSIKKRKLSLKEIKAGGFKDLAVKKSINDYAVINAYKMLFKQINLEIVLDENNNANSSLVSLNYYKNNIIQK